MSLSYLKIVGLPEDKRIAQGKTANTKVSWNKYYGDSVNQVVQAYYSPSGKRTSMSLTINNDDSSGETVFRESPVLDELGKWRVDYQIYAKDSGNYDISRNISETFTVYEPLRGKVSISPRNVTISIGQSAVLDYTVTGVALPYTVTQKWYKNGVLFSEDKPVTYPYEKVGTDTFKVEVTVTKGSETIVITDETVVNSVKSTMDGISVTVNSSSPSAEITSSANFTANVTGAPAGVSISYDWSVNDDHAGSEKDLIFTRKEVGTYNVKCIVSVKSDDYEGVTVTSPEVPIEFVKMIAAPHSAEIVGLYYFEKMYWGHGSGESIGVNGTYSGVPDYKNYPFEISDKDVAKVTIDGVEVFSGIPTTPNFYSMEYIEPSLCGKTVEIKVSGKSKENPYFEQQDFEISKTVTIGKQPEWNAKGIFRVDGKFLTASNNFYFSGAKGNLIEFDVINLLDYIKDTPAEYAQEIETLSKKGKYELIDFQGNPVVEAVNGKFSYTLPNESKQLVGKIRHTFTDDMYVDAVPLVAESDIILEVLDNPIDPTPILDFETVPTNITLDQTFTIKPKWTNLPDGATTENITWKINGKIVTSPEVTMKAENFNYTISASAIVKKDGFNDTPVSSHESTIDINRKAWPNLSLDLVPNKTLLKWGENLIVSASIVGKELVENFDQLSVDSVTWFIDDKFISLSDIKDSFTVAAVNPGQHEISTKARLSHPDYDGDLILDEKFNVTTEKREMAITLSLLPTDAVVTIKDSQRFTALVEGAPADSSTTYAWEVDGTKNPSTTNYLDYTPTVAGKHKIKVTSTTVAEGADNVVLTKEVEMTANKMVMSITAEASATKTTVKQDESFSVSVDVKNAPNGSTFAYKWSTGETSKTVTRSEHLAGDYTLNCVVTATHPDYDEAIVSSNGVKIKVEKIVVQGVANISVDKESITLGESYEATVDAMTSVDGTSITYLWNNGATTQAVSVTPTAPGKSTSSVTVTFKHPDYLDRVIELSVDVSVASPPIEGDCIRHIHPLDSRDSSFIWCGYWVLDELQDAVAKGIDWKNPEANGLKYACELLTIAKMIQDYPNVEIQESRHGWIITKNQIDIGIIY
ncbi:outer capsid protein [Acinetobacter phage AB1I1M-1]